MEALFHYITPPPDASTEWLDGYYTALRQVGTMLAAEAEQQGPLSAAQYDQMDASRPPVRDRTSITHISYRKLF